MQESGWNTADGVADQRLRAELALCDAIEAAADDLPALAPRRGRRLAQALRALARAGEIGTISRRLGEIDVAPEQRDRLTRALALLAREERADADLAVELADALDAATRDPEADEPAPTEPELAQRAATLGYLMRCFFDARRRHLAWRSYALIAPLGAVLDPEALRRLIASSGGPLDLRVLYEVAGAEVAAE